MRDTHLENHRMQLKRPFHIYDDPLGVGSVLTHIIQNHFRFNSRCFEELNLIDLNRVYLMGPNNKPPEPSCLMIRFENSLSPVFWQSMKKSYKTLPHTDWNNNFYPYKVRSYSNQNYTKKKLIITLWPPWPIKILLLS